MKYVHNVTKLSLFETKVVGSVPDPSQPTNPELIRELINKPETGLS